MHTVRGFSLIELLVGMLIALVVALAAYAVFKTSAMTARRVMATEAAWHGAELALLSMGKSVQQAGYLMDLSASGATSPVIAAANPAAAYQAPNGFATQQLSLTTNVSGVPGNVVSSTDVWSIGISATTGNPALLLTTTLNGTTTQSEYADGVVAMRFQFSCSSSPNQYVTLVCPGGASDAKSVQIALLSRDASPDISVQVNGKSGAAVVAASSYTFPDVSVYTVPTVGGVGCTNGDCTRYRHRLFVTELPLRNLNWGL